MSAKQFGLKSDYKHAASGASFSACWIQVTNFLYMPFRSMSITYDVYIDNQSFLDGLSSILSNQYINIDISGPEWNDYFDPNQPNQLGTMVNNQILTFMKSQISAANAPSIPIATPV